jgi:hypothetical protein
MSRFEHQLGPRDIDQLMNEINNHLADVAIDIARGVEIDEISLDGDIAEKTPVRPVEDYDNGEYWWYGSNGRIY